MHTKNIPRRYTPNKHGQSAQVQLTRHGPAVGGWAAPLRQRNSVPNVQEAGWVPGPGGICPANLAQTGIRTLDTTASNVWIYRLSYPGRLITHMLATQLIYRLSNPGCLITHMATQSSVLWRMRLASQRQAYECNWWSTSSDLRRPVTGWRPLVGESVCYCRTQNTALQHNKLCHQATPVNAEQAKSVPWPLTTPVVTWQAFKLPTETAQLPDRIT